MVLMVVVGMAVVAMWCPWVFTMSEAGIGKVKRWQSAYNEQLTHEWIKPNVNNSKQ